MRKRHSTSAVSPGPARRVRGRRKEDLDDKESASLLDPTSVAASAMAFALPALADPDLPNVPSMQLATGQFITPTRRRSRAAILNPGLAAYPNFIAARRALAAQPDGTTLAVFAPAQLARQGRRHDRRRGVDAVHLPLRRERRAPRGARADAGDPADQLPRGPRLSPDGGTSTPPAAATTRVRLHEDGRLVGAQRDDRARPRRHGLGVSVAPNASGLGLSADGKTLVVVNNYNDSISVIDTATGTVRYEHDLRPSSPATKASAAASADLPVRRRREGQRHAYVSSDRNRESSSSISARRPRPPRQAHPARRNALGMTLDRSGARLFVAQDNATRSRSSTPAQRRRRQDRRARAGRPALRG